jgi:hypothetical protein
MMVQQILAALKAAQTNGWLRSALTAAPVCHKDKIAGEETKEKAFPFLSQFPEPRRFIKNVELEKKHLTQSRLLIRLPSLQVYIDLETFTWQRENSVQSRSPQRVVLALKRQSGMEH